LNGLIIASIFFIITSQLGFYRPEIETKSVFIDDNSVKE
jgi:hypothetical protein